MSLSAGSSACHQHHQQPVVACGFAAALPPLLSTSLRAPPHKTHRHLHPMSHQRALRTNSTSDNGNGNGSYHQSLDPTISILRAEIDALREVLHMQSRQISQQTQTTELLRTYMKGRQSPVIESLAKEDSAAMQSLAAASLGDRRKLGMFDARYHSTSSGATPKDFRVLPKRIILVRHAESEGNVDNRAYTYLPDPQVPLTPKGWRQAMDAGERIRELAMCGENECGIDFDAEDIGEGGQLRPATKTGCRLFFYTSPYLRSRQTYEGVAQAFAPDEIAGVQEEVQLREQDFGNFQDAEGKKREKAERLRFGRFFYRFPNGESGADVYDRMTLFEDHLVRDINAGRFAGDSSLILVTHGLALRIFLMRWFHWTVDQFMGVYNPPNAVPLVLERVTDESGSRQDGPAAWIHTKALYKLTEESMMVLQGCTPDMCTTSWLARGLPKREMPLSQRPREVHELLQPVEGERQGMAPL